VNAVAGQSSTKYSNVLYQSITFDLSGQAVDTDLETHIRPNNVVPDGQKGNIGIRVNTGGLTTFNSATGPATHHQNTTSVQLRAPTGLVKVAGFEVTPEVAATLAEAAPSLTEDPSIKAAEAAKAETEAQQAEADRADLNTHPIPEIEAAHMHLNDMVSMQDRIALMVVGARGETPSASLINRIADQMHLPIDKAIDAINLVSAGTSAQFTALCNAMGLDAGKAQTWIKGHRADTGMVAAQAHLMRRDVKAWTPLLDAYQQATGDGRSH
jgi:hypothetical protein